MCDYLQQPQTHSESELIKNSISCAGLPAEPGEPKPVLVRIGHKSKLSVRDSQ